MPPTYLFYDLAPYTRASVHLCSLELENSINLRVFFCLPTCFGQGHGIHLSIEPPPNETSVWIAPVSCYLRSYAMCRYFFSYQRSVTPLPMRPHTSKTFLVQLNKKDLPRISDPLPNERCKVPAGEHIPSKEFLLQATKALGDLLGEG